MGVNVHDCLLNVLIKIVHYVIYHLYINTGNEISK